MTTEQVSERPSTSARLLWTVLLLVLAAAGLLWAASGLNWADQSFRTATGMTAAGAKGAVARPELGPIALASLAAIAAVLATGGLLRRFVGVLVALAGVLLGWRCVNWFVQGPVVAPPSAGPGTAAAGPPAAHLAGPGLMLLGALLLVAAGALVTARATRMPAMGAKYSAPGAEKPKSKDPDRRLWEELDAGTDPTAEPER